MKRLLILLCLMGCTPKVELEVPPDSWQFVTGNPSEWVQTHRMKVPGGWLYRERLSASNGNGISVSTSICFVPDIAAERS